MQAVELACRINSWEKLDMEDHLTWFLDMEEKMPEAWLSVNHLIVVSFKAVLDMPKLILYFPLKVKESRKPLCVLIVGRIASGHSGYVGSLTGTFL
eukprot:scaffold250337_cov17-Tisochrysis_lutea.AAC.1